MKEINPKDFTDRGWEEDSMLPPVFFYPKKTGVPHLHLTSVFEPEQKEKPVMEYLGYKDKHGNTEIVFKDKKWNQKIVDGISDKNIKNEANFAKQYSE